MRLFVFTVRHHDSYTNDVHVFSVINGIGVKIVNHQRITIGNVFDAVGQLNVGEVAVDLVIANTPSPCHAGYTAGCEREVQWKSDKEKGDAPHGNLGVSVGFQIVQRHHLVRPHPNR